MVDMEQIWEKFFLNAFRGSSVTIVSGLNILAAESFLHLAVPAEAWPEGPPRRLHCAPGPTGNSLKSAF